MHDHTKGLLITTLGVLLIVPDSLFVRLIDADAWTIAFWRTLSAGLVGTLGLLVLMRSRTLGAIRATGWQGLLYAFGVCTTGVMFVAAVSLTSVANVVFIIASMPVFAALFSRVVLGERIRWRMALTMGAVAIGLGMIGLGSGPHGGTTTRLEGDLIALGVAVIFAAVLTAARTRREVSMAPAVPPAFLLGAALLWPLAEPGSIAPTQWWMVALHGGVFIVLSMVLLSIGPRYITSAEVSMLILLESVLAPLLVWAVLGEHPGVWTLAGGTVVVAALLALHLHALLGRGADPAGRRGG